MNERLAALHAALRAEEEAARQEHDRIGALPYDDQQALGHAWPPLDLREIEHAGRRRILTLQAARGTALHEGITPGEPVFIERGALRLPATVDEVQGRTAILSLSSRERAEITAGPARVYLRFDPSTFVRYRQALERADTKPSPLRELLLADRPAPLLPEGEVDDPQANSSQRRAIHAALAATDLAVIWGPPGTGKTWVLARILARLVARGEHPWALAESNAAVDHLARAALSQGLTVVRLGPLSRVEEDLRSLHLSTRVDRSLYGPALATLRREMRKTWGSPAWARLRAEHDAIEERARAEILASAQVIASTFGTLSRLGPELPPPGTVVVDEATQVLEPAIFAAVPHADRLVLAGDPEQLGPVVKTRGLLERSLLQRLVGEGVPSIMLEEQHRMAPELRELVQPVYGPRYRESPRMPPRAKLLEQHALWIDTAQASEELRDPLSSSLYEPLEIEIVAAVVARLRAEGLSPADLGVITPYSAQVSRLSDRRELEGVEVATVNAFQGRERDVIIASFVRSNPARDLGFVADERRLTVAITRARRQLLLVGDAATLSTHPRFAALLELLSSRGALRSVWEPPYDEALTRS